MPEGLRNLNEKMEWLHPLFCGLGTKTGHEQNGDCIANVWIPKHGAIRSLRLFGLFLIMCGTVGLIALVSAPRWWCCLLHSGFTSGVKEKLCARHCGISSLCYIYCMFGDQNPELYRPYVRFDCLIAHSKALGDCKGVVLVSIFR